MTEEEIIQQPIQSVTIEEEMVQQIQSILTPDEVSSESLHENTTIELPAEKHAPPSISKVNRRLLANLDELHQTQITAETVYEYQWPPYSSSNRYMIQEQIADYLNVKSFKRRYPDLSRHTVDGEEKEFLRQQGVVTQTLCNMGITALRVKEVLDLMAQDFPDKLAEYQKVVAEKTKQEMAAKQMEYQAIKADSKRLAELRKRALRATSEWNAEMNKDRKVERSCFFEEQTMLIHYPTKKQKKTCSDPGPYPVAVMPGQFQNYYKSYTPAELQLLPLNTVMDADPFILRPCYSPEPITADETEIVKPEEKPAKEKPSKSERRGSKSGLAFVKTERSSVEETKDFNEHCAFCCEDIRPIDKYVQCSKCGSCGHPNCMEMSEEMFTVIKSYTWMCMECKPCSICSKLDEEDKMMFCDRCDRGYHTFCVGLNDLPSGRWTCPKFCGKDNGGPNTPVQNLDLGSRSSTPVDQSKCAECGQTIIREEGKSRKSRQRRVLCENCTKKK